VTEEAIQISSESNKRTERQSRDNTEGKGIPDPNDVMVARE
jgi:hypothetical protein